MKPEVTTYKGKRLYVVPEISLRSCEGCCFNEDRESDCPHVKKFDCRTNPVICVEDFEKYQVDVVTFKLTGELP